MANSSPGVRLPPGLLCSDSETATQSRERRRVALVCRELGNSIHASLDDKFDALAVKVDLVLSGLSLLLGTDWQDYLARKDVKSNYSMRPQFSLCRPTDSETTASTTEAFDIFDERADAGVQTDDTHGYAGLCSIDLTGEWQAIDDTVGPQKERVAGSCRTCLQSHSAMMEEAQPMKIGDKVQVIEEVRSVDGKLILCIGEVYDVLAFKDGFAELEFMGDCMPDGSKIVTTIGKDGLKCFGPWVQT